MDELVAYTQIDRTRWSGWFNGALMSERMAEVAAAGLSSSRTKYTPGQIIDAVREIREFRTSQG